MIKIVNYKKLIEIVSLNKQFIKTGKQDRKINNIW